MDIQQGVSGGLRELHLFAGAGGGILGGKLLGHRCVCAVEIDPYAQAVLVARQNDGSLDPFPIWDDVCTFDGNQWRGAVDIVCGGFPCQDISVAGKGAGLDGERSGLWREFARIIGEVRPRYVFVENSAALVNRGLGVVLGDLATLGYDAQWGVLAASDVGAQHQRERIWILAHSNSNGLQGAPRPRGAGAEDGGIYPWGKTARGISQAWPRWPDESGLDRIVNGVANRSDRIRAIGNGQVPRVAAAAFTMLRNHAGV